MRPASTASADGPYYRLNFNEGPAKRLVAIYVSEGRIDDARRVLLDFVEV